MQCCPIHSILRRLASVLYMLCYCITAANCPLTFTHFSNMYNFFNHFNHLFLRRMNDIDEISSRPFHHTAPTCNICINTLSDCSLDATCLTFCFIHNAVIRWPFTLQDHVYGISVWWFHAMHVIFSRGNITANFLYLSNAFYIRLISSQYLVKKISKTRSQYASLWV